MEIFSQDVWNYLDESIEQYGVNRGMKIAKQTMKKIQLYLPPLTPSRIVQEYVNENVEEFERVLREKKFLRKDECIGAYNFYKSYMIIYVVNRIGKIRLM